MPNIKKSILIVGATGAAAKRLVDVLLTDTNYHLIGLSRRPNKSLANRSNYSDIHIDLLDESSVFEGLKKIPKITHIFYTARAKHEEGGFESIPENSLMFKNLLLGIDRHLANLQHIHLVQGGKYYGIHLGPYPTPAIEDDTRPKIDNFYYVQEDMLKKFQVGKAWTWSASRPNVICDFSTDRARNLSYLIGLYALVMKEMGLPLYFPGNEGNWNALTEVTDAHHYAKAMIHIATNKSCINQAFNVSNGDIFRWKRIWPSFAEYFSMKVGEVRPLNLFNFMLDKEDMLDALRVRNNLIEFPSDFARKSWAFADFVFAQNYDVISSTTKIRLSGFNEIVDSKNMFIAHFNEYRKNKVFP